MKSPIATLAAITVFTALVSLPADLHGVQAAPPQDHAQHHAAQADDKATVPAESQANMMASMMASMKASDAKLDELVKKMNAAKGSDKTDAMAELLTAMVQEHRTMRASMMTNMSMMPHMMGGMGGRGDATSTTPKK